jgi:hypothetical protein
MPKDRRHPIEVAGYTVVVLVLLGFLLVGVFLPTPQARAFDAVLTLLTLFALTVVVLGRWVFRK